MGTELTYDGDDARCRHHLDDMAMPRCLPTRSAVGLSQYFTVPHLFLQESSHSSGIPLESSRLRSNTVLNSPYCPNLQNYIRSEEHTSELQSPA